LRSLRKTLQPLQLRKRQKDNRRRDGREKVQSGKDSKIQ
jgi:hypothetical protein